MKINLSGYILAAVFAWLWGYGEASQLLSAFAGSWRNMHTNDWKYGLYELLPYTIVIFVSQKQMIRGVRVITKTI